MITSVAHLGVLGLVALVPSWLGAVAQPPLSPSVARASRDTDSARRLPRRRSSSSSVAVGTPLLSIWMTRISPVVLGRFDLLKPLGRAPSQPQDAPLDDLRRRDRAQKPAQRGPDLREAELGRQP